MAVIGCVWKYGMYAPPKWQFYWAKWESTIGPLDGMGHHGAPRQTHLGGALGSCEWPGVKHLGAPPGLHRDSWHSPVAWAAWRHGANGVQQPPATQVAFRWCELLCNSARCGVLLKHVWTSKSLSYRIYRSPSHRIHRYPWPGLMMNSTGSSSAASSCWMLTGTKLTVIWVDGIIQQPLPAGNFIHGRPVRNPRICCLLLQSLMSTLDELLNQLFWIGGVHPNSDDSPKKMIRCLTNYSQPSLHWQWIFQQLSFQLWGWPRSRTWELRKALHSWWLGMAGQLTTGTFLRANGFGHLAVEAELPDFGLEAESRCLNVESQQGSNAG